MSLHLNRKLELEEVTRVPDGAGGYSEVWQSKGTLWATIKAGSGREKFGAGLTTSSVPYRIIVRAAPVEAPSRPVPDQRFREGARMFRIVAVADYGNDLAFLTCFATEEVAG